MRFRIHPCRHISRYVIAVGAPGSSAGSGNFHGFPWLIHKLLYRRTNSRNVHVRGHKEHGNINTPMELAIRNPIDRFNLVIDAIDRVPRLQVAGAHVKEHMKDMILKSLGYATEEGVDPPEYTAWRWQSASPANP